MLFLNENRIKQALQKGLSSPFHLHLRSCLDSTNSFLKELPSDPLLHICCAEQQTQGRGRLGRLWHSPFGQHIYCSSRWQLKEKSSHFSGLSLVVALAVLATLRELIQPEPPILIKWPNDLLWAHKKLAGILIELISNSKHNSQVIIGIGINVNAHPLSETPIEQPWTSLYEITNSYQDRNLLIARLLINLETYLQKLEEQQFKAFLEEWHSVDYLAGHDLSLTQAMQKISGLAQGVNELGQLIVKDRAGRLHYLCSGDTSINRKKI